MCLCWIKFHVQQQGSRDASADNTTAKNIVTPLLLQCQAVTVALRRFAINAVNRSMSRVRLTRVMSTQFCSACSARSGQPYGTSVRLAPLRLCWLPFNTCWQYEHFFGMETVDFRAFCCGGWVLLDGGGDGVMFRVAAGGNGRDGKSGLNFGALDDPANPTPHSGEGKNIGCTMTGIAGGRKNG